MYTTLPGPSTGPGSKHFLCLWTGTVILQYTATHTRAKMGGWWLFNICISVHDAMWIYMLLLWLCNYIFGPYSRSGRPAYQILNSSVSIHWWIFENKSNGERDRKIVTRCLSECVRRRSRKIWRKNFRQPPDPCFRFMNRPKQTILLCCAPNERNIIINKWN